MFLKRLINKRDKYKIRVIDEYPLNLYCICLDCDNWKSKRSELPPHACGAYPKYRGIPKEIWKAKNGNCKYYIPVKENVDK